MSLLNILRNNEDRDFKLIRVIEDGNNLHLCYINIGVNIQLNNNNNKEDSVSSSLESENKNYLKKTLFINKQPIIITNSSVIDR